MRLSSLRGRRFAQFLQSGGDASGVVGAAFAAWGNGDHGRLGLGAPPRSGALPVALGSAALAGCGGARQVACGGAHTLFLTAAGCGADSGAVFAAGLNDRGQLGLAVAVERSLAPCSSLLPPSCLPSSNNCSRSGLQEPQHVAGLPAPARSVAAGHHFSSCITEDGDLWVWGDNRQDQLGLGTSSGRLAHVPQRLEALAGADVVGVACGASHALAVLGSGEVYAWGAGASGQLGLGTQPLFQRLAGTTSERLPRLLRTLQGVKVGHQRRGGAHAFSVHFWCEAPSPDAGELFTFGGNRFGQLGIGTERDVPQPVLIDGLRGVEGVACGGYHTAALAGCGDLSVWGGNEGGCLGLGRNVLANVPGPTRVEADAVKQLTMVQVACGWKHTAAVSANGILFVWGWGGAPGAAVGSGDSGGGQLGLDNDYDQPVPAHVALLATNRDREGPPQRLLPVLQVSCGFNHTAAVLARAPTVATTAAAHTSSMTPSTVANTTNTMPCMGPLLPPLR
eukprot:SM000216S06571  [mRNA]  locus=s216:185144:189462:+ [translate_table: standard]